MTTDTIVIGAGPAGLATSRELSRRGVDHVVLERGPTLGHTWVHLYDSLVLHTGKHLSALPGMPFPSATPLFPRRAEFLDYLARYAAVFHLPVETDADVRAVERTDTGWTVRAAPGAERRSRALVVATGIVANPYRAAVPGRDRFAGTVIHSVDYRRPGEYRGERVLVVGTGNSAGEIAAELAANGAGVTIAVRSGARVVPRELLGIPIQYVAVLLSRLPRSLRLRMMAAIDRASQLARGPTGLPVPRAERCSDVPLIGFHLVDAIRAGTVRLAPALVAFTATGVRFADGSEQPFDRVILATGYRAALGILGEGIRRDRCGFASRRDRVVSIDQPDLYFVGHNYDTRGALRNIAEDARRVGRLIGEQRAGGSHEP